jgi:hypothetical protein
MKIGSDGARKVWENCCIGKTLEEAVHEAQQASDTYYGGTEIPLEQRNYLLQVLETGGLFNELPSQEVQIAVRISNLMDSVIQVGFMEMEQVKNAINEAAGLIDTAPRNIRWYCIGDIVWLCRSLQNQGGVPPKPQEARQEMAPPQAGAQAGEEARQEMALQQAGVQAEEEDEEAIEPVEEEEDPPQRCNVQ